MKEPLKDDERLAALFDGRLDAGQRAELLAHLSAGGEDYDVYTEAAAILQTLEERERGGASPARRVLPFRLSGVRAWKWSPARVAALAAVLAAVAVTAVLTLRRPGTGTVDPVRLAATADPGRQGLPDRWPPAWGGVRGSALRGRAGAARAGAILVDLSVAVQSHDSVATRRYATQLRERFEPAGGASPLRRISENPAAPIDSLQPLVSRATQQLSDRLGRDHVQLGAWLEAARLAAQTQHAEFFEPGETRAMLDRAARLTKRNAPAHAAVDRIRAQLAADGARDWTALGKDLSAVLDAIAS